jgi:hypothetical protein
MGHVNKSKDPPGDFTGAPPHIASHVTALSRKFLGRSLDLPKDWVVAIFGHRDIDTIYAEVARADCDVTESAIPKDSVAAIDFAGTRKSLAESDIGIGGSYAAETFGNPSDGIKQGATYDGVLKLHLDGDIKKKGLRKGLCFHANGYQTHGQSITAENIGSLATVSNLEVTPATRLYEWGFLYSDVSGGF